MKPLQFLDASRIYRPEPNPLPVECPLVITRVAAGFPSSAEIEYIDELEF